MECGGKFARPTVERRPGKAEGLTGMVRLANALLICSLAALPASGQTSAARTPNPKTRSERPAASHLTVTLIATELFRARRGRTETGTPTGTVEDVARVKRLLAFALLDKSQKPQIAMDRRNQTCGWHAGGLSTS